MTMPRWWDNRFTFRLVLVALLVSAGFHLATFLPGEVPLPLQLLFLCPWAAVSLGQLWRVRHRLHPNYVPPVAARRSSFWPQLRAELTNGPRRDQLLTVGYFVFAGYMLLSLVLIWADPTPQNGMFRFITLFTINQCLIWLWSRNAPPRTLVTGSVT